MPRTVLLVEDQAFIAMHEERILKKNGYNVTIAYNGDTAIKTMETDSIDLILMDIDLGKGKIDGTETAKRILKTHDVPIVFVSSHTEPEIIERTEQITSYGYIVKGCSEAFLIASLKMAFKLHHAYREAKTAREKLEESESRFKAFLQNIPGAAFIKDSEDNIVYCNNSFAAIINTRPENIIGCNPNETLPPEIEKQYKEENRQIRREEKLIQSKSEIPSEEGSTHWLTYKFPVPAGSEILVGGISMNITAQKQLEESLKKSEARYRHLFELSPDGIVTLDLEGKITSVNDSFLKLSGYGNEDFIDKHFTAIPTLMKQDFKTYGKLFLDTVRKRPITKICFKWRHADGSQRKGEAWIRKMDPPGSNPLIQCIVRDITIQETAKKS